MKKQSQKEEKEMEDERTYDVGSVMDILYGGSPGRKYSKFVCGSDGKKTIQECEIVCNTEDNKKYPTFWRKKDK